MPWNFIIPGGSYFYRPSTHRNSCSPLAGFFFFFVTSGPRRMRAPGAAPVPCHYARNRGLVVVVVAAGRGHHGRVARLLHRTITAADLFRVVVVAVLESWSLLPQQGEGTTAVWPASSLAASLRPTCSASSLSSSSPSKAGRYCRSREGRVPRPCGLPPPSRRRCGQPASLCRRRRLES